MDTSCTKLLEALKATVSPLPWRKNSLGVTVDAKGEPVSLVYIRNETFGIAAVNHFAACVKALEADLAATRHPPSCHECQAGEWCEDRSNLVIRASGLRNDVLVDVRRALEAALPRSRLGSGEVK